MRDELRDLAARFTDQATAAAIADRLTPLIKTIAIHAAIDASRQQQAPSLA